MAKDDPHFRLRIPADLKNRVANAAHRNTRSINAEIVATLEEKFPAVFSLDVFMEEWVKPISALTDRAEQERMVEQAFSVIQGGRSDWFVWLESEDDTKPYNVSIGNIPGPLIRPPRKWRNKGKSGWQTPNTRKEVEE